MLKYKTADDIVGTAAALPGLDNAREVVRWVLQSRKRRNLRPGIYRWQINTLYPFSS
jgi:hypothetical protein